MWKGIGVPPDYGLLFGGLIESIGVATVIILMVNRKRIKKLTDRALTQMAIRLVISAVFCLGIYLFLLQVCVVHHPTHGTVYFPLWTTGRINQIISKTGGRYAALDRYGNHSINTEVQKMPAYSVAIAVTTVLLLFLYQSIFTLLTVAFGLLGFHQGKAFS